VSDCVVISAGKPFSGLQGLSCFEGVSAEEPCRAVIARTDANEQESVVLLDAQGRKS
jgi:uncharacterized RmlC-like cupin family protein